MKIPFVSLILPVRDEVRFIEKCLTTVLAQTYPRENMEIIVVDGMSTDGTRNLIARVAEREKRVVRLDNPRKTAPAALNLGIAKARGSVIMRIDAHCEFPRDYVQSLVATLMRERADNVGGITEVVPSADTPTARAIALALADPAGVGNSYFRIGSGAPRWVDTVPFGCWHRATFDKVGMFDESLPRNQDDEFNMRLIKSGGRILLVPTVVARYYARTTFGQLWRMFWQYGYYKPLAAIRSGASLQPRQFVPAAFVTSLALGVLLSPFGWFGRGILKVVVISYLTLLVSTAIPVAIGHGWKVAAAFCRALATMHFGYGLGFLRGVVEFAILKRAPPALAPRLSR